MHRIELDIVTRAGRRIAATAFLPAPQAASGCAIFASPGGGYGRGYYDMHFAGHDDYSQAAHHVGQGHVVVAYDHLGVGDSDTAQLAEMTIEDIADHDHDAVAQIIARLRTGMLHDSFPAMPHVFSVGIGQSMGGGVTIIMQARQRSFDAIAVLGYSAIHTVLPQRTAAEIAQGIAAYDYDRTTPGELLSLEASSAQVPDFVYPFHWEDVPADILATDMAGGYPIRHTAPPFGSLTIPPCVIAMMSPGFVREEAAAIDVPVLLGFGERDTSMDVRAEPGAFTRAADVSLFVVPRMAHMHNFASTRRLLWDRISDWTLMTARAATPKEK